MIDIKSLTETEKQELRLALGMERAPNSKAVFFRDIENDFIDFIPEEHHYMDVRHRVLKEMIYLTDYVCGNYCYGRRNTSIGSWQDGQEFDKNYKQFVYELCDLMRKHLWTPRG